MTKPIHGSPKPSEQPWRSPWLNWLEEVQTISGARRHTAAEIAELRGMFDHGASALKGADYLRGNR